MAGVRRRLVRDVQECCALGDNGPGAAGEGQSPLRHKAQPQVSATLVVEDDLSHLKGKITGPCGTPYSGGVFQIDIKMPQKYPFEPPKMTFDTLVYHPNISSVTGAICLDILKDAWTPILTIKTALLSVLSLLQSPNPYDPQDAEVASLFLSNYPEFERTARYWTEVYASPRDDYLRPDIPPLDQRTAETTVHCTKRNCRGEDRDGYEDGSGGSDEPEGRKTKVRRIVQMGFAEQDVHAALQKCEGDEQRAVEHLLA